MNQKRKRRVVTRSSETNISEFSKAEELQGKLKMNNVDDKLMHSVLDNDQEVISDGKVIEDALNQGVSSFTPNLMFEKLVQNYSLAKDIYGESILRQLSGYDPDYIERNINIPEFQKVLKDNIERNVKKLTKKNILDKDFTITDKGIELASIVMYVEELDHIVPAGIRGEWVKKKKSDYGSKDEVKSFSKGDRYKDISIKKSIKQAVRRGHDSVAVQDLKVFERKSKGQCTIIYALDASGSMKGDKIKSCKKAGIALAYKAIKNKDPVGLIVFGDEIRNHVEPTKDFGRILKQIVNVRASSQTDLAMTINESIKLFPQNDSTKHLLLLTDAVPTSGADPENETLKAVRIARDFGITVSLIGIKLDNKGKAIAEKIVEAGDGKLYIIKDLEEIDKIVLVDYYSFA